MPTFNENVIITGRLEVNDLGRFFTRGVGVTGPLVASPEAGNTPSSVISVLCDSTSGNNGAVSIKQNGAGPGLVAESGANDGIQGHSGSQAFRGPIPEMATAFGLAVKAAQGSMGKVRMAMVFWVCPIMR
jgi:hypothetical protein